MHMDKIDHSECFFLTSNRKKKDKSTKSLKTKHIWNGPDLPHKRGAVHGAASLHVIAHTTEWTLPPELTILSWYTLNEHMYMLSDPCHIKSPQHCLLHKQFINNPMCPYTIKIQCLFVFVICWWWRSMLIQWIFYHRPLGHCSVSAYRNFGAPVVPWCLKFQTTTTRGLSYIPSAALNGEVYLIGYWAPSKASC